MGVPDEQLDRVSRNILSEIDDLKALERKKRRTTRSSPEFHQLAAQIESAARHVFDHAGTEKAMAEDDSPIPSERDSTEAGDWTRHRDN
jgi:hypothetical protein